MNTNNRSTKVELPVNNSYKHDLSHRHTTTLDFFRLQPVFCQDMVPGDKMSVDIRSIIQSAPMATQVFGGAHLDLHAFFVPNRIVWDGWDEYITHNSQTDVDLTPPFYTLRDLKNIATGSFDVKECRRVYSSLGYPVYSNATSDTFPFSALQARAYQRIWFDYYRDSVNIPDGTFVLETTSGHADPNYIMPHYRCFKKDFLTTLLSSPQYGVGSSSPVTSSLGDVLGDPHDTVYPLFTTAKGTTLIDGSQTSTGYFTKYNQKVTVSALRGAVALQRFLERLNVSGTRPMERLLSIMGVKPSVERLNMAEFIGAHTIKVNIDGLVNTGSNEEVSSDSSTFGMHNAWGVQNNNGSVGNNHLGQGYQSGYASGSGNTNKFSYSATEHGHFIIIASLIPEYCNPNAVSRQFYRGVSTPEPSAFDYFTPDLDGVGYQEMLLSEVVLPTAIDTDVNDTWLNDYDPYKVVGYQPKYEDYRFVQDRLSGDFLDSDSALALRNMVFTRDLPSKFNPDDVYVRALLTTANFGDRESFDMHFQITDSSLDHFVLHMYIVNDAIRPISNNQLPTELSDMANSHMLDVSNGGVRL